MIIVHASMNVDPAKQELFLKEIQSLVASSRNESGNVSYNLYKDTEKEGAYTMVEIWQDEAAVAAHNASEHFTGFVGVAKQFLTPPLAIKAFSGQPINK